MGSSRRYVSVIPSLVIEEIRANMTTNYHRILEVPADASRDQIRAQYKQLVRIFHPDRFTSNADKEFVEQKLKEINEAYHALLNPGGQKGQIGNSAPLPQPIVLPSGLDFGEIASGEESTLVFHVGNTGGPAHRFSLNCDEQNTWFRVTRGKRVNPSQPFPMEFAIVANTQVLESNHTYTSWIDVHMDGVVKRIPLSVQVVDKRLISPFSPRVVMLGVLLVVALIFITPHALNFQLPAFLRSEQPVLAMTPAPQTSTENTPSASATSVDVVDGSVLASGDFPNLGEPQVTPNVIALSDYRTTPTVVTETDAAETSAALAIEAIIATPTRTATPLPTATPSVASSPTEPTPAERDVVTAAPTTQTLANIPLFPWLAYLAPSNLEASVIKATATATSTETAAPTNTSTPTASATLVPTNTPEPTPTLRATSTRIPTQVPTPTATPVQASAATRPSAPYGVVARVPTTYKVYVRSDISVDAPALALLDFGVEVPVIGRTYDSAWILILLPGSSARQEAWVFARTVVVDNALLETVPVVVPRSLRDS